MNNWNEIWTSGLVYEIAKTSTSLVDVCNKLGKQLNRKISVNALKSSRKRLKAQGHNLPALELQGKQESVPKWETSSDELKTHRLNQQVQDTKQALKNTLQQLHDAEEQINLLLSIKGKTTPKIIAKKNSKKLQATAVALASDWHVEECVDSATVNGKNEYNPTIAETRAQKFFEGVMWLVEHHRKSIDIDNLVL